jgi:RNA polymerase sigma factor (sigma-70 family)
MPEVSDMDLVRDYHRQGSEAAFAELVRRHMNLVYSAALRQTGRAAPAEEITQAVFIILARQTVCLRPGMVLEAWLYETTRLTTLRFLRGERRRQFREQEAYMQSTLSTPEDTALWNQLAPLLDEALARLGKKDREAVVLRYFKEKHLGEVAAAMQITEAAAQSRVHRAVAKLRRFFYKRGVVLSVAAMAGAISAHSAEGAPADLAKTLSALALTKGAAAGGSTLTLVKGAMQLMAWTKAKTAIVVGVGVLLAASTATVTVNTIQTHRTAFWQVPTWDFAMLDKAPPQVRIVPTKFPNSKSGGWGIIGEKSIGMVESPVAILQAAKGWPSPVRMISPSGLPTGKYDFIANRPKGSSAALELLVKKKFGLVGRLETRETVVLQLQVEHPHAAGLKPATGTDPKTNIRLGAFSATQAPLTRLTAYLEDYFQIPVVDHTGLEGSFDLHLEWIDDWQNRNPEGLKQALLDQLGLALVPGREPIELLLVEKVK